MSLPSMTVTAISGAFAGAKAVNQEYMRCGLPPINVPVLAATGIEARAGEVPGPRNTRAQVPLRVVIWSILPSDRAVDAFIASPETERAVPARRDRRTRSPPLA